jgi:hypothetical protein
MPIIFGGLAVWAAHQYPELLLDQNAFRLPIANVWQFVIGLTAGLTSVVIAHLRENVSNALVWPAMAVYGTFLISFYAFLFQYDGVLCSSAYCDVPKTLPREHPQLSTKLGQPLPHIENSIDCTTQLCLVRDTTTQNTLFFSIVTFTTLGYGDFQPTPRMRLIAASEAIIGYLYLGLLVGAAIDAGRRGRSSPSKNRNQPVKDRDNRDDCHRQVYNIHGLPPFLNNYSITHFTKY